MERRTTRLGSNKKRLSDAPSQRFLSLGPNFRAQARANSPSRQVSPPFTCPVQPLKAAPRSGHGRLPKASRVRACEARPRGAASDRFGLPLADQAFALSHFRIASRSAPHWTGHEQDKGGRTDGDRYTFTFS